MGIAPALVFGCVGALLVALVAASFLRLAVSATNKFVGSERARKPASGGIAKWDWDDWDDEYASTVPARHPPPAGSGAVPEPGIPKCMALVLVAAVAFGGGFIVLGAFAEELIGLRMWRDDSQLVLAVLSLPVADLALTVLLGAMLPTTFGRAAMVTFLFNLILLAAVLCSAVIVVFLTTVLD